jgi:hypothetical protein
MLSPHHCPLSQALSPLGSVPTMFSNLTLLNRELIFPSSLDGIVSPLMNHMQHSLPLFFTFVELLLVNHKYPFYPPALSLPLLPLRPSLLLSLPLLMQSHNYTFSFFKKKILSLNRYRGKAKQDLVMTSALLLVYTCVLFGTRIFGGWWVYSFFGEIPLVFKPVFILIAGKILILSYFIGRFISLSLHK